MRNLPRLTIVGALVLLGGTVASAQQAGPAAAFPGPGMAAATGMPPCFAAGCWDPAGTLAGFAIDPKSTVRTELAQDTCPDAAP
jgi:hypothetical protein